MDTDTVCAPAPGAPSSSPAATKAASASPPDRRANIASLQTRAQFDRVFREGTRRRSGPVVAITWRRPADGSIGPEGNPHESAETRLGLVASRRVGNAVVRNRAKRRLRHAVREAGGKPGHDVIVIADARVATMGWLELVDRVTESMGTGEDETVSEKT